MFNYTLSPTPLTSSTPFLVPITAAVDSTAAGSGPGSGRVNRKAGASLGVERSISGAPPSTAASLASLGAEGKHIVGLTQGVREKPHPSTTTRGQQTPRQVLGAVDES